MRQLSPTELRGQGAIISRDISDLLAYSGLTPPRLPTDNYDSQLSGSMLMTNRRGSLDARRVKKKDGIPHFLSDEAKDRIIFDDDGLFPFGRRLGRRRRLTDGEKGERKANTDAEDSNRAANAEDGDKTTSADADGDSQRATDAPEGDSPRANAGTPDAEGSRINADAPEGPRVHVNAPRMRNMQGVAQDTPHRQPARGFAESGLPESLRTLAPEAPERPVTPEMPESGRILSPSIVGDRISPIIELDTRAPSSQPAPVAEATPDVNITPESAVETPRTNGRALSPDLPNRSGSPDAPDIPQSITEPPSRQPAPDVMDVAPEMDMPAAESTDGIRINSAADSPVVGRTGPDAPDLPDADGIDTRNLAGLFGDSHNAIHVDTDLPEMRAPELGRAVEITPHTDAEIIRNQASSLAVQDVPDVAPASPEPPARVGTAASPWDTHLESRGTTVEEFTAAVNEPAPANDIDIGANGADTPASRLNAGRTGRFVRLAMPSHFDVGVTLGFIGVFSGIAAFQTASIASADEADIQLGGVGVDLNGGAIGGAAADATPWIDAIAAYGRGRDQEGTVRLIVNGVETATPFVFAAAGAAWGGAGGSAAGGIGAIPGVLLGGTGGFLVGLVASSGIAIAVDEGLRMTTRAMGWDVDRGFVSSLLAPEFADDMEAWAGSVYGQGVSLPDDATPQQVVDDILASTDDPIERITRFREFMSIMNASLHSQQEEHLDSIRDVVEQQTGITDIRAVLDGEPSQREDFLSFYQEQLEQDPNNETAQMVITAVAEYYALQDNRFMVQQGILNADIMHALSLNEEIRANVDDTLNDTHFAFMATSMDESLIPELIEIDAAGRMHALRDYIETQQDDYNTDTGALIEAVAENGGNAYTATRAWHIAGETAILYEDMEEALEAAAERIVRTNMDDFEIFFDNFDRLRIDMDALREDYGEEMPEELSEFERIIAESDNFENLTESQKVALATNPVFHDVISHSGDNPNAWYQIGRDNPYEDLQSAYFDLRRNLSNDGFLQVGHTLYDVRERRAELEDTFDRFGLYADVQEAPENTAELNMQRHGRLDMTHQPT